MSIIKQDYGEIGGFSVIDYNYVKSVVDSHIHTIGLDITDGQQLIRVEYIMTAQIKYITHT